MKQGCHKDLDAGLAIFLAELGELEGSLANTGLGGFVVNLVDVGRDSGDLEVLLFKPTAKLLLEFLLRVAVVAWEEKSPSTTIITELDVNGSKLTKNVV